MSATPQQPASKLSAFLFIAFVLTGCGVFGEPPPREDGESVPGSINCTIDVRNCEPGQKR